MAHFEIVDLPIKNGDFPVRYVNVYHGVILDVFGATHGTSPQQLGWHEISGLSRNDHDTFWVMTPIKSTTIGE